jgi:hypothetical protein
MENQACKFIFIHAKDERCCRSCQQEYKKDYVNDGSHIQGLARNTSFFSCLLHHNKNVYNNYTLFVGL